MEEEDSIECVNAKMTELDNEEKTMMLEPWSLEQNMTNEEKEIIKPTTPKTKTGSNDVNNTPKEVNFAQYVHLKERQY